MFHASILSQIWEHVWIIRFETHLMLSRSLTWARDWGGRRLSNILNCSALGFSLWARSSWTAPWPPIGPSNLSPAPPRLFRDKHMFFLSVYFCDNNSSIKSYRMCVLLMWRSDDDWRYPVAAVHHIPGPGHAAATVSVTVVVSRSRYRHTGPWAILACIIADVFREYRSCLTVMCLTCNPRHIVN